MQTQTVIDVQNLNFEYNGKRVLHDVSFAIREGDITALVGPNGAGKTTLLRSLVGLDFPLSGVITVDGVHVQEHPREAHRRLGYLSDFFGLYEGLTVRQCLTYTGWSHGIGGKELEQRIVSVAEQTEIADKLNDLSATLSRGYRQRVGIAMTLLHDPKILVLDEPASGMDPEARHGLSSLMKALKQQGKTILVSSHILSELEDYCTDMLVIREGRVAEHVRLGENARAQKERSLKISVLGDAGAVIGFLKTLPVVTGCEKQGEAIHLRFTGEMEEQYGLLQSLVHKGFKVVSFAEEHHSLQSAYMTIAQKSK